MPEGFISELSSVLLVNTDGGWFDWFVPLQAYKLLSCFSPLPCSPFWPNRNALLSNFWQLIYHSKQAVDCIPANKPSIASCFSCTLTVFYSPTWNTQSSKFWQRISLPMLLALADYWLWGVWITSQVPLTPGQSQVINWIAHRWVQWVGLETSLPCSNHPNCNVLTEQFADSAYSNYMICWPGRYSKLTQYDHRTVGAFDLYGCQWYKIIMMKLITSFSLRINCILYTPISEIPKTGENAFIDLT